jgi:5,10-methylenetetrahydromethanopterin reductase
MRIGIFLGEPSGDDPLGALTDDLREVAVSGFASAWVPHILGLDSLIALSVIAREVPHIEVGTAVIPVYPRHPMLMAQQALTTQFAANGRLVLGLGVGHQIQMEGMLGYSYDKPARYMREYLNALLPMLRGEPVGYEGERIVNRGQLTIAPRDPVPVLLAALAPRMLELAGGVADGTVTSMTGPIGLEQHIVPLITKAAADAGRPAPRVCCFLPVGVTDDVDGLRDTMAARFVGYPDLPAYRAMLDREGVDSPLDIAIIGNEEEVAAALERIRSAGATDFIAAPIDAGEDRSRTFAALQAFL